MNMKQKPTIFFLMIMVLMIFSAGCQDTQGPPSPPSIKVGILLPMSGDLAEKGNDCENGVILATQEINETGGITSLGGARIELIFGDTQSNPDIGAREAERLISEQGVIALIGTYQSSVAKPATQVAERLKTPFIINVGIADILTERGFRYTFRVLPKAQFYGRDQVRFLSDLTNQTGYPTRRVALLHENSDFGTAAALAQKEALRKNGFEIVAEVSYVAEGADNMNDEVAQVLSAKPDVILEVTYLKDSILIRQALSRAGVNIPLVDTAGGTVSAGYVKELGPLADGTLTLSEYSKFAPGGKELNDKFRTEFGSDITGDSAYSYQAVWVLKDVLERSGSVEKEKLREALVTTDMLKGPHMILPAERIQFDNEGQNKFASLFMMQIQNGTLIPVWPTEYAVTGVNLKK